MVIFAFVVPAAYFFILYFLRHRLQVLSRENYLPLLVFIIAFVVPAAVSSCTFCAAACRCASADVVAGCMLMVYAHNTCCRGTHTAQESLLLLLLLRLLYWRLCSCAEL